MLTIWGRTSSINVQKVMWAVGELGLEHSRIDVGGAFGGLDTPDYVKMNPNKRIPVLKDGDLIVWESNAVVRYLSAKYGPTTLWPEDPAQRSVADRWMDWMATTLIPDMTVVFWQLIRTPEDKRDMPAVRESAKRLGPNWEILDQHMSDRAFVAGDQVTMGDIPVGCAYWRYINLDVERPNLPNLQQWFQDLKKREPYRQHAMIPVT